ncbi:MAG: DEAD/DEAH box helicase family protein [Sandaracinus sp.]
MTDDLEGQDRVIATLRDYVDAWRGFRLRQAYEPYPQDQPARYEPVAEGERALTETSRTLLQHWFRPEPHDLPNGAAFKYWPHQRRAVETFIYLHEVRGIRRTEQLYELTGADSLGAQFDPWAKLGAQLATGSGKTKIMSLLVAWSTLNAAADPRNAMGLGRHALIVVPGLFVRDRLLADFRPPGRDPKPSVFFTDPVIPPELESSWDLNVYDPVTCPRRLDPSRGALVITNYHPLLRDPEDPLPSVGSKAQLGIDLLFAKADPSLLESVTTTLAERFEGSRGLLVINDEAHHVGDEPTHAEFERKRREKKKLGSDEEEAMAWIRCLRKVHGTRATSRIALQVDLSATLFTEQGMKKVAAKKKGEKEKRVLRSTDLFRHTAVRYDLPAAIRDGIVKRPVLERITVKNSETGEPEDLVREGAANAWDKYRNLIVTGVRRWKKVQQQLREEGDPRKPILFLLCQEKNEAREVANFLRHGDATAADLEGREPIGFPDPEGGAPLFVEKDDRGAVRSTVVEVHIGQKEERNQEDWDRIRDVVNAIDADEVVDKEGRRHANPFNVVVSVMMLKEGWDVRNVKVIVPLRPCDSRTLTEQILGRGLRKMHAPEIQEDGAAVMRAEELYVMEHPSFAHILEQVEDILDVKGSDEIGHTPEYVGIVPKDDAAEREKRNVRLVRFEGLVRVEQSWHSLFDPKKLNALSPRLAWLTTIPETEIKTFLMEMLRREMEAGQEFRVGESYSYRDLEQVIEGAYVKPILEEMKVGYAHRAAVKSVVRSFLERGTFALPAGLPVRFDSIEDPESGKVILGNLARGEVRSAVRRALVPELQVAMRGGTQTAERAQLSERQTKDLERYQAVRKNVLDPSGKTVFVRTATDSEPEARLARLLDRAIDVEAWVYNHRQGVGFFLEYDHLGHVHRYFPDYVARARLGSVIHNVIVEVKGRFDDRDRKKARRGRWYADMLGRYDREPWHYVLLVENRPEQREDLTWWEQQPVPTVEDLLRRHESLPLLPDEGTEKLRFDEDPPQEDRYRRAVPVLDLGVKGGPLGPARVAEAVRWAYVPTGVHVDDRSFVAQVTGRSMEPKVASGTWCLFRAFPDDAAAASAALDRRRVLVEVQGAAEGDDEGRYVLKRVVVTARGEGGEAQEVELRSDNPKFPPIRIAGSEARVTVRAELVRTLSG